MIGVIELNYGTYIVFKNADDFSLAAKHMAAGIICEKKNNALIPTDNEIRMQLLHDDDSICDAITDSAHKKVLEMADIGSELYNIKQTLIKLAKEINAKSTGEGEKTS